jgi:hypothetical protein
LFENALCSHARAGVAAARIRQIGSMVFIVIRLLQRE